jgi:hypothetical protein
MVVVLVGDEDALKVFLPRAERGQGLLDAIPAAPHAGVHERPAVVVF